MGQSCKPGKVFCMSFYTQWQGCHVHVEVCIRHIHLEPLYSSPVRCYVCAVERVQKTIKCTYSHLHMVQHLGVMLHAAGKVHKTDICTYRLLHMVQHLNVMLHAAGKVHKTDTCMYRGPQMVQQLSVMLYAVGIGRTTDTCMYRLLHMVQ